VALGEKISELRKQRGWTQEMLGEKAGVHTNHVSRWECNRIRPSGKALRRLAAAFNVTYDELLENEQPPVPDGIMDDPELVDRFRQLQQLEPEDQAVLFRLLDLMSRHRQVARLMSGKD
jgi:transcriptional regulator with XRE-family HTH domain